MTKARAGKKGVAPVHHATAKVEKDGLAMVATYLPEGSTERKVATVGAAVAGALLAAAVLGVGPAALAGAAGYLVYQETAH